jgi:hypothetical protein
MSSEDERDFSSGANSPKSIEFVEDDLNIDIEILVSEVQARHSLRDKTLNNYFLTGIYLKRAARKEIVISCYTQITKNYHEKVNAARVHTEHVILMIYYDQGSGVKAFAYFYGLT